MISMVDKYIDDVLSDKIVIGSIAKMAVQRHVDDLKDAENRGLFYSEPWVKDALKFCNKHRHTGGNLMGKPFDLQPAQAFFLAMQFGWRMDNGDRRFLESYHSMARKGGKTELAGVIGNIAWTLERYGGSEYYTAATQKKQAQVTFKVIKKQLEYLAEDTPFLKKHLQFLKYQVLDKSIEGFVEALPGNSDKLDALRPYVAIIDEYHAHKDSSLKEVIRSGMGHTETPLTHITTTAGFNIESACYKLRGVGIDILKGIKQDDRFLFVDHTLDPGDDWKDPEVWQKPNPNIGKAPFKSFLIGEVKSAVNEGASKEVAVKTKNFNLWTSTSVTWIPDDVWVRASSPIDKAGLKGRECYGGLDLASTRDLNAYCLFFPKLPQEEQHKVLMFYWTPRDTALNRSKTDRVDYLQWDRDGLMELIPGAATDQDKILDKIMALRSSYKIKHIGCDEWNASQMIGKLNANGIETFPFRQGYKSMSPACKTVERLVYNDELNHGNCPILRWNISNVELTMDPAENIKIDKKNSRDKVDGAVALVMAVQMWVDDPTKKDSVYTGRGIRTI